MTVCVFMRSSENHEGLRDSEPVRRLCCVLQLPERMKEESVEQSH